MNITEYAMFKKMLGKGGNAGGDAEVFIATGDVEIFVSSGEAAITLQDALRLMDKEIDVFIQTVPTLPEKLIKSDETTRAFIYVDEQTGIAYANFGGDIITAGMAVFEDDAHDKGWATDTNSITTAGVYCVRKNSGGGDSIVTICVFDQDYCGPYEITYTNAMGVRVSAVVENGGEITLNARAGTVMTIAGMFSTADIVKDGTVYSTYDYDNELIALPFDAGNYYMTIYG